MRIAVNTRFLLSHKMEGFGWYTYETISRIVNNHPEHEFVFFFDRPFDEKFVFGDHVKPVVLQPPARHPLLFKIWFNYSVALALKRYRCDAFISPDGYLSLRTSTPQLAVIHDLNFEHNPEDLPPAMLNYLRRNFPAFAKRANRICTVSNFSKKDLVNTYGIDAAKIDVTHNGVSSIFKPLQRNELASARKEFSNGQPYIFFVGALHKRKNLQRLVEAFESLKNIYGIPHNLVIAGESMWKRKSQQLELPEQLKDSIFFTGHLDSDSLSFAMGGATCLAFVSYFEGFGIPMLEAMRSGVPVLAGNKTALPEVGGSAALYCDPYSVDDISTQLYNLVSNEALRSSLRKKGLERAKLFSWDQTAAALWSSFEKMMAATDQ
ncbi:MAG: glycosyltransferase family 4 protein [Bacteroidota bacterium]